MKIFLVLNTKNKEKKARCLQTVESLSPYHELSLSITQAFEMDKPSLIKFDIEEADLIMSVGGDGTLLKAAHLAYPLHKPILGVNAGHVGALCAMKYFELSPLDPIKGCHLEERYGVEFSAKNLSGFALNEIVVCGISRSKCIELEVEVAKKKLTLKGDGFLFASPTGSGAYNKSLGGPVLDKEETVSVFLPLAPIDDDYRKPFMVKENETVLAKVSRESESSPLAIYDGQELGIFKGDLKIKRSKHPLLLYLK